ncbi:dTDP-4-dehydrorhamnose reductase [Rubrimonas cliftonensis]|uniref:dTDP-4-dehydrorhamnose reductase n=1 Tax=Rubrimonas cliftonensis TaxID=89524 RepID=UPI000B870147|nr:dTDP-4-dehydrorhamnose reductase [Rubrimonas cliftonensis]
MSLLVFGSTGQVGVELRRLGGPDLAIESLDRAAADLADPEACAARVARTGADVVVNAAAYTAVDRAEGDEAAATVVNGAAPGAMARAAAARGIPFLHVSTDYVFDGGGARPWRETDPVAPLGAYGRSKLEGERRVAEAGGPHAVLRTAWVHAAHGSNFVRTMLRLGAERDALRIVDDQRGGPTAAADVAAALVAIARAFAEGRGVSGVFHYAGAPTVSWREFAEAIFERAHWLAPPRIEPIPSEAYPTPAPRPRNSALDCGRIGAAYGLRQPDWRCSLEAIMKELGEARDGVGA